ncbi:MAG: hypothetical protein Q4B10_08025 [Actinomycetaceae bacterium]|nr:hypothetical protein [Actinomycetaceae bacterium]
MFELSPHQIWTILFYLFVVIPFGGGFIGLAVVAAWEGVKTVMTWKDTRAARRSTIKTLEAAYAHPWPEEEKEACR